MHRPPLNTPLSTPINTFLSLAICLGLLSIPACGSEQEPAQNPPKAEPLAAQPVGTVRILAPGTRASDPVISEGSTSTHPTTNQPGEQPPLAGPRVSPPNSTSSDPADSTADAMQAVSRPLEAVAARSLGHRAAAVRMAQKIVPTVVIVNDPASFADAISGWTHETRFPVLFDDGSVQAAEHIARFVRAFEPEHVVGFGSGKPWPTDRASRQKRILEARSKSLGLEPKPGQSHDDAMRRWLESIDYPPAGAILTDAADPAWPAALALSAGRLEPIVFIPTSGMNPGGGMSITRANSIDTQLQSSLDKLGVAYRDLGSDIDAITLVGRFAVRVNVGDKDYRSLTDRIGRTSGETGSDPSLAGTPTRWAWCGQIFGSEPYAAYAAMCSLFLETSSLWAFDGYDPGFGKGYEIDQAAKLLEQTMGFSTTLFDRTNNGLETWRTAVSRGGINAGLVMVNTHGNSPEFNLPNKQRAYAGDVPLLNRPALVQFIHSFSMQHPDDTKTVGGRWLDHGAYAYLGSMHEPYLDAFVQPVSLAARLAEGWAFGAAARSDHRGWWRITLHGDPLITLGPAGTRVNTPLTLSGTKGIADEIPPALESGDFDLAIRLLVLLGRDEDAARLVSGLLNDKPNQITPEIAVAGLGALFRENKHADVLRLWKHAKPNSISIPVLSDTLWGAARSELRSGSRAATISLLKNNLRPDQQASDAGEIAEWIARDSGRSAAAAYLRSLQNRLSTDTRTKRILAQAIRKHSP